MKTVIKAGLSADKRKEVDQEFAASGLLREQLVKVLSDKIESAHKECRAKSTYEVSNWAYLQADALGYERALEEAISLLK